jgi:sialate O-acetylesterase
VMMLPFLLLLPAATAAAATTPGWVRGDAGTLRFSRAHGDHMVLAAAPKKASVWGFGEAGQTVTVVVSSAVAAVDAATQAVVGADGQWKSFLAPVAAGATPHTVTATSGAQTAKLSDVVFGQVWVCGGQSNSE